MDYSALVKELLRARNIYSFVVEVFVWLSAEKTPSFSREYASFVSQETIVLHEIRALTDLIPDAINADFPFWRSEWIDFLEDNKDNCKMICYQTLKNFDELIPKLLENSSRPVADHGPLNDYAQQNAFLYITAPSGFFEAYFAQNKIRCGRQTVLHNAIGLNRCFKRFFVIKKSSTNDYIPTIKLYRTNMFSGDEIKIGCSPFEPTPWFDEEPYPDSDAFGIKYDINLCSKHNRRISDLIELFDTHKVEIVTFPELALNNSSLKAIQHFLVQTELKHVKLICTGSCWNDQKNEAYILSKDGTVLLKYQKKKTYQRYDKEKGIYTSENITSDPFVSFLDIPGIGRIAYNICYDFDNDDVEILCSSVMMSNFMFVAAYSNDTHLMEEKAVANASLRGITTILTNACASAEDGQLISYIVEPVAENKHLISKNILNFRKGDVCSDCKNCVKEAIISTKELAKSESK